MSENLLRHEAPAPEAGKTSRRLKRMALWALGTGILAGAMTQSIGGGLVGAGIGAIIGFPERNNSRTPDL